jgi:hypothetical protein
MPDGMGDLELRSSARSCISIANIDCQNTVRQALDSREIARIAIPFGTSVLWDCLQSDKTRPPKTVQQEHDRLHELAVLGPIGTDKRSSCPQTSNIAASHSLPI